MSKSIYEKFGTNKDAEQGGITLDYGDGLTIKIARAGGSNIKFEKAAQAKGMASSVAPRAAPASPAGACVAFAAGVMRPVPPAWPILPIMANTISLAVMPSAASPLTSIFMAFSTRLFQRLGGQYVFNLRGADTKGQRTECTVSSGMRVTANDSHARQGHALFWPDNVHNSLIGMIQVI